MQKLRQWCLTVLFLLSQSFKNTTIPVLISFLSLHRLCILDVIINMGIFFFFEDNYKPATFMNQQDQVVVVGVVFFLPLSWMTCFGAQGPKHT